MLAQLFSVVDRCYFFESVSKLLDILASDRDPFRFLGLYFINYPYS